MQFFEELVENVDEGFHDDIYSIISLGEKYSKDAIAQEHLELAKILKDHSLSSLYKKLRDGDVRVDILFELENSDLDRMGFSETEKRIYYKSRNDYRNMVQGKRLKTLNIHANLSYKAKEKIICKSYSVFL